MAPPSTTDDSGSSPAYPPAITPFVVVDLDEEVAPAVFGPFATLELAERYGNTHLSFYAVTHLLGPDDAEVMV